MSVGDYLKQAAVQIRRAALASRDETSKLRHDLMIREQEVNKQVQDIKREIGVKTAEMAHINDSVWHAERMVEINKLQTALRDIQHGFEREKQQITDEIHRMEGQVSTLDMQANDFERQAGQFS